VFFFSRVFDRDGTGFLRKDEFRQMLEYNGFSDSKQVLRKEGPFEKASFDLFQGELLLKRAEEEVFSVRDAMDFDTFLNLITNRPRLSGARKRPGNHFPPF